jgi:hypothetical protein
MISYVNHLISLHVPYWVVMLLFFVSGGGAPCFDILQQMAVEVLEVNLYWPRRTSDDFVVLTSTQSSALSCCSVVSFTLVYIKSLQCDNFIMDKLQAVLNSILFVDKFTPPNTALTDGAKHIHEAFWDDSFNRNLRLEDAEIEIRLGKAPPSGKGSFNTSIPERMFNVMCESLQSYTQWDNSFQKRDLVGYFPNIDESMRAVQDESGTTVISKQKVLQADFVGKDLPFDFRLAVNLELKINDKVNINTATRTVVRDRVSYCLGNIRYDLTKLTHANGKKEFQVELEIIDPPEIQLTCVNAQEITLEIQHRLINLMNACEPVRSFNVELLRKRHF